MFSIILYPSSLFRGDISAFVICYLLFGLPILSGWEVSSQEGRERSVLFSSRFYRGETLFSSSFPDSLTSLIITLTKGR